MEVAGELFEACGDAPVMLEFVEEALDAVAQPVGILVIGDLGFSRAVRRNDDVDIGICEEDAEMIGVVALVGDDADQRQAIDDGLQLRSTRAPGPP